MTDSQFDRIKAEQKIEQFGRELERAERQRDKTHAEAAKALKGLTSRDQRERREAHEVLFDLIPKLRDLAETVAACERRLLRANEDLGRA